MNHQLEQLLRINSLIALEILKKNSRNTFNSFGYKCYSQNEEDGLIAEILRRIGVGSSGKFVEFGVGNGMECNTLQLLLSGWRGICIGNEDLAFPVPDQSPLIYVKGFVNLENFPQIVRVIQKEGKNVDFLSMDLDGNDAFFIRELLVLEPKVICAEYNASFPPPARFCIDYNPVHVWNNNDYFGASLQAFVDILADYKLVCCNATGVNAFFVRKEFGYLFADVPENVSDIYMPPRFNLLSDLKGGHPISREIIQKALGGSTNQYRS